MLQEGLVKTLLKRGIINTTTQVLAVFNKVDHSLRSLRLKDFFKVNSVEEGKTGKHTFDLSRIETSELYKLPTDQIILIDGMEPTEIAKAYDLNLDGSNKVMGKPRGRPKIIR